LFSKKEDTLHPLMPTLFYGQKQKKKQEFGPFEGGDLT
jgi:hypothetical protein